MDNSCDPNKPAGEYYTDQQEREQDYPRGTMPGWMVHGRWYPDAAGISQDVVRRPPTYAPANTHGSFPYIPGQASYPQHPPIGFPQPNVQPNPPPLQPPPAVLPGRIPQGHVGPLPITSGPAVMPSQVCQGYVGPLPVTSGPAMLPGRITGGHMVPIIPASDPPGTINPALLTRRPAQDPKGALPVTSGGAMPPVRPAQGPMGILPRPGNPGAGATPQPFVGARG